MPERKNEAVPAHATKPGDRLRKIGLNILLAGIAIAGLIYLFGPQESDSDENSLLNQYYKNQELETERLWGGGGSLILEITRSFRRASTWSVLVLVISALVSFACFYLASHPHDDGSKEPENPSPE